MTFDACDLSQASEAGGDDLAAERTAVLRLKKWLIVLVSSPGKLDALLDEIRDFRSERHEARLVKLCISYGNESKCEINIHEPEAKCLAKPHARSIQEQE